MTRQTRDEGLGTNEGEKGSLSDEGTKGAEERNAPRIKGTQEMRRVDEIFTPTAAAAINGDEDDNKTRV